MRHPGLTEEMVQAQIIEGLRAHRLTVLQTTVRGKQSLWCPDCRERFSTQKCPRCHRHVGMPKGTTPGVPDLIVSRETWPVGVWLGIEVKGPATRVSAEQQALAAAGRIVVARSFEDAIGAVRELDARLAG